MNSQALLLSTVSESRERYFSYLKVGSRGRPRVRGGRAAFQRVQSLWNPKPTTKWLWDPGQIVLPLINFLRSLYRFLGASQG